jgi:16S rRNA (cytosine1402-N4)-methyltransferase
MPDPSTIHISVLPDEILHWIDPQPGQTIVDGTLGGAGHTRQLADKVGDEGLIISIDADEAALNAAERILKGLPIKLVHSDYRDLPEILDQLEIDAVDAVLLDLGLSSDQLADAERGFSFATDGPLDLRFNTLEGEPASRLVNRLGEKTLADLIYRYGEERYSRRIARKIVERRRTSPLETSAELAQLVRSCIPRSKHGERIDPATRTFQALRIAVNDELGALESILQRIPDCLRPGGRAAIISFHSLEDRLVKTAFRDDSRYDVLTKKPIRPTDAEILRNPRSRSARLRVAERSTQELAQ